LPTELVRRAGVAAAACPCLPFDWNNAGSDADVRVIAPPAQPSGRVGATGRTRRIGGQRCTPRLPVSMVAVESTSDDESRALEHLVSRLADQFPEVPRDSVRSIVHASWEEFSGRPVRAFVPVLAERNARQRLRGVR